MRYFHYIDEDSPVGNGITYIETDKGYAIRQITICGNRYMASNQRYPPWSLCLAEGKIDYDLLDEDIVEISGAEFEEKWQLGLAQDQSRWLAIKQIYPTGREVQGWFEIFFPQGAIINLGEDILGVADYSACKESAAPEWMSPGFKVSAQVTDYDETNHWLILGNPKVNGERIRDHRIS